MRRRVGQLARPTFRSPRIYRFRTEGASPPLVYIVLRGMVCTHVVLQKHCCCVAHSRHACVSRARAAAAVFPRRRSVLFGARPKPWRLGARVRAPSRVPAPSRHLLLTLGAYIPPCPFLSRAHVRTLVTYCRVYTPALLGQFSVSLGRGPRRSFAAREKKCRPVARLLAA